MFGSLLIVTQPAVEPVDLDLVKRHCRVDSDYDDDLLTTYAMSARIWAEEYLNRALVTQEIVYNITSSPPPSTQPLVPQSLIVFPLNWPITSRRPVALPRSRVQELKSFTYGPYEDMQTADPSDYTANLAVEPAQVSIRGPLIPMIPAQSAAFTYIAGYGDAPEDVPLPIRHAILVLTAYLYEQRGDVAADIPTAALRLMSPFRLWQYHAA